MTEQITLSAGLAPVVHLDSIGSLQLEALAAAYADGLSPVEVARAVYARALRFLDTNAWIHLVDLDDLLLAAHTLLTRWPHPAERPTLFGIPIAVKDNIDIAGLPTTAACPDFSYIPDHSAHLIERLLDAGALMIGKTNLDQFATGLNGTRSPYGECRSPFDPTLVSGGSSSGSALAVSLGLVSAAIGTDTAGSGRVPAAFSNVVGLKPSLGLVSGRGVLPACRSLDCPSVFALSVPDAALVLSVMAAPDPTDPWSRPLPAPPAVPNPGAAVRIGIPRLPADLAGQSVFAAAAELLAEGGAALVPVDLSPFLEAGELLYEGPWVAERLAHLEDFLLTRPESLHPVTREILVRAREVSAAETFRGIHRLAELKLLSRKAFQSIDVLMVPTVPGPCSVADIESAPIEANKLLGRYTTFANLLDLTAIAVPCGFVDGLPVSATVLAPAGADQLVASLATFLHQSCGVRAGALDEAVLCIPPRQRTVPEGVLVAVAGAHRRGQPLHPRLTELGALYVETAWTSESYRMIALPGGLRPGLIRVTEGGESVEVELHRIPSAGLGTLVSEIPAPLAIGTVVLADGRSITGFVCETYGADGAQDITSYGSWPAWLERSTARTNRQA